MQNFKLDANGHIPAGAANEYLRAMANQLLDGQDVDKVKGRTQDIPAAEALAGRYGWQQGKLTPMEMTRVQESVKILIGLRDSQVLNVLDDASSRAKLAQAINIDPHKSGRIGTLFNNWLSSNMTPAEREFYRLYMQSVGRITGLSQLTRTGRPTEATIQRLMSELPNPSTPNGASSADAKESLKYLLDEVNIALQKRTFEGSVPPAEGTPQTTPAQTGPGSKSETDDILRQNGLGDLVPK
jgi:hypothetical protein